jgi:peptidoglycan hydrolase-like protein with peptidoglycan-binding domain
MKEAVAIAKEADAKKGVSPIKSDNSIQRLRDVPEMQLGSLSGVIGNITRDGSTPSVESIATQMSRMPTGERAPALLALQQTHGNRYVQRVVSGIQAKLKIGQPGDIYEHEADRVADEVMRMPEPGLQRQLESEEEEEDILQTKTLDNTTPEVTHDLESHIYALPGGGTPLSGHVRAFFEPRFGHDFTQVRVHTDSRAADVAELLNARAFTIGQDIVFGMDEYAPETVAGQRLLAHELVHTIQQTNEGTERGEQLTHLRRTIGDGHDLASPRFAGDPVLEACYDNERLLRRGHRGPAVEKIQQALVDAGFALPMYGVDGIFGSETKTAVRNYQRAHGLSVDGIIGPITMGSLDAEFVSAPPTPPTPPTASPQFPRYNQVVADADVQTAVTAAWSNTLAAATPTSRREEGFWIRQNTGTRRYEFTTTIHGPVVGPTHRATIRLGTRPADTNPGTAGATYTVASFHTHTPSRFRLVGRPVGPSTADRNADMADDVTGVVYDYIESPPGTGNIPASHPLRSPAQTYRSGPDRRRRR